MPTFGKKNPQGQIINYNGQNLAVLDLGKTVSKDLTKYFNNEILEHGEALKTGGAFGTAALPILGAGSAVASSLAAGNVFMATAAPSTLMSIGGGVGSAVIGAGGKIIAQAPFIAASSAIIPVVAPVMFFMTVSSMMMSVRFDQIQEQLKQTYKLVETLLIRDIAADYGTIYSGKERLADIEAEFSESRRFTQEMKMRLVMAEQDISAIRWKYHILGNMEMSKQLSTKKSNVACYVQSSILDLWVENLRLKLSLQDNPDDVQRKSTVLADKISRYEDEFQQLLKNYNRQVEDYRVDLELSQKKLKGIKDLGKRILFNKKAKAERDAETEAKMQDKRSVSTNIEQGIETMQGMDKQMEEIDKQMTEIEEGVKNYSVLWHREDGGKGELKSYYTNDIALKTEKVA